MEAIVIVVSFILLRMLLILLNKVKNGMVVVAVGSLFFEMRIRISNSRVCARASCSFSSSFEETGTQRKGMKDLAFP